MQPLLDAVCDYLPSPLDLPPTKGKNPKNEEEVIERMASADEKLSGLAFKASRGRFSTSFGPRSPCFVSVLL